MIDHITLPVSNLERSIRFYTAALAPLGYGLTSSAESRIQKGAGFGVKDVEGLRDFWLKEDIESVRGSKYCIAFKAENKDIVEQFHHAAISAGGKDNGAPGYRPQYHKDYYAAFVYDPDGYNIEVIYDDFEIQS